MSARLLLGRAGAMLESFYSHFARAYHNIYSANMGCGGSSLIKSMEDLVYTLLAHD